jgi:hypothetical protein
VATIGERSEKRWGVELRLAVVPRADEDVGDTAPSRAGLWEELAELDEVTVEELPDAVADGAKGVGGLGGLLARVPVTGVTALAQFLRAWVVRTGRAVEVSIAGDTIKITGASREQQDRVIEAWLVRHASGT